MSMRIEFTLALIVLLFPTSLAATISVPADYTSIQAAIDAAQDGDVIEVQSGIYYENVDINKPLTLRGLGMPTVDAGGKVSAIDLSADGITLEGFVATNGNTGIGITSDYNIIRGNNAHANRFYGIFLYESSNNNIEGNNVSCNYDDGIGLDKRSNNNTIKGNDASYNYCDGISLKKSGNNSLEGNRINYNEGRGVKLYSSSNNNIRLSASTLQIIVFFAVPPQQSYNLNKIIIQIRYR